MTDRPGMAWLLVLCLAGVLVRALFLGLTHGIDFVADEGYYVQSALAWNHYGFYGDQYRYLWPPGYPFFLARCFALFEEDGVLGAKLVQVLASASVGLSTMLLARRAFGEGAARIAGVIWCLYLPLIGFTHTLWSETLFLALFLPAIVQLLPVLQDPERPDAARRIVIAGLCLAGGLYLKQALLLLIPLVALLLFVHGGPGLSRRLWPATLLLLAAGVPSLPWTLRNAEVYGRAVPMGATLGENAFRGLNARHASFDTVLVAAARRGEGRPFPRPRRWLTAPPAPSLPGWKRAEELSNTIDRQHEGLQRGLSFAADHPTWFLRSRVQKLADWLAPLSFFLRHQALGSYADTPLGATLPRRLTVVWALLSPLLVLGLAVVGMSRLTAPSVRRTFVTLIGYFLLTAFVVAMSRFRMPVVPLCIVLAAGALGGRASIRIMPAAVGMTVLFALWWVDAPLVFAVLQDAWGGPA